MSLKKSIRIGGNALGAFLLAVLPSSLGRGAPGLTINGQSCVPDIELYGISASSAKDLWVLGERRHKNCQVTNVLIHWNGFRWTSPRLSASPLPKSPETVIDVVAISARDAWAVGFYGTDGGQSKPLTLHWDGRTWKRLPAPSPSNSGLECVAASSAGNVWAAGFHGGNDTLIEHWNGRKWMKIPNPNPSAFGNHFLGLTTLSAHDAWAVGYKGGTTSRDNARTLVEHWNGRRWLQVPSPAPPATPQTGTRVSELDGVTATSSKNAWAVGTYGAYPHTLILHWNGKNWRKVPSPNPRSGRGITSAGGSLASAAALSPADVWAVGRTRAGRTLIVRWNGTSWRRSPSPNPDARRGSDLLYAVTATSPSNAWAVGDTSYSADTLHGFILRWNGSTWTRFPYP